MRCPKCNFENPSGASYCSKCQTSLSVKMRPSVKKCPRCHTVYKSADVKYCSKCQCELIARTKDKRTPVIVGSIASIGVLAVGAISVLFLYPIASFNAAIRNGDTSKLVSVFRSHPNLLDNNKRSNQYKEMIVRRVDDYIAEYIDYGKVKEDFENFDIINSHLIDQDSSRITQDQQDRIERIHSSREVFQDGEASFNSKSFQNAENEYSNVIQEDEKYYNLAQGKLAEIDAIKVSYLQTATEKRTNGEYEECISTLTEGLKYFEYDSSYAEKYTDGIVSCVEIESDFLIDQGCFFSDAYSQGAFNIVYSYLNQDRYSNNEALQSKLNEIADKSMESELDFATSSLQLTDRNIVIDSCAVKAAEAFMKDESIQNDSMYIVSLCRDNADIQSLISTIPKEQQVNVALISNIAMTASDFANVSKEQTDIYRAFRWDYTGLGRYYDEEQRCFSWATIIIYETG